MYVMIEAVLVGEKKGGRGGVGVGVGACGWRWRVGGHSLAYLAIGFGDLEGGGLCVYRRPEVSGRISMGSGRAFIATESVFAYASNPATVTPRVLGSMEGVRVCKARHVPSPQSPLGCMATFFSRLQALDADVTDFNERE